MKVTGFSTSNNVKNHCSICAIYWIQFSCRLYSHEMQSIHFYSRIRFWQQNHNKTNHFCFVFKMKSSPSRGAQQLMVETSTGSIGLLHLHREGPLGPYSENSLSELPLAAVRRIDSGQVLEVKRSQLEWLVKQHKKSRWLYTTYCIVIFLFCIAMIDWLKYTTQRIVLCNTCIKRQFMFVLMLI